jgi:hypothetical protein
LPLSAEGLDAGFGGRSASSIFAITCACCPPPPLRNDTRRSTVRFVGLTPEDVEVLEGGKDVGLVRVGGALVPENRGTKPGEDVGGPGAGGRGVRPVRDVGSDGG